MWAATKPDLLLSLSGAATMQRNASEKRKQAVELRRLAEVSGRANDRTYLNRLAQLRDREAEALELREGSETSRPVGQPPS